MGPLYDLILDPQTCELFERSNRLKIEAIAAAARSGCASRPLEAILLRVTEALGYQNGFLNFSQLTSVFPRGGINDVARRLFFLFAERIA